MAAYVWCRRAHSKSTHQMSTESSWIRMASAFGNLSFFKDKKFHNKFGGLKPKSPYYVFIFGSVAAKKSFVYLNIPKTTVAYEWVERSERRAEGMCVYPHDVIYLCASCCWEELVILSHSPATFYVSFDNLLITY